MTDTDTENTAVAALQARVQRLKMNITDARGFASVHRQALKMQRSAIGAAKEEIVDLEEAIRVLQDHVEQEKIHIHFRTTNPPVSHSTPADSYTVPEVPVATGYRF